MKYIDAEELKAEIERRRLSNRYITTEGYEQELYELIDSFQQEQPKVDDIKREWYNKGYLEGRKNAHIPARELGLPKECDFQHEQQEVDLEKEAEGYWVDAGWSKIMTLGKFKHIARHFYEFGLNARKKE